MKKELTIAEEVKQYLAQNGMFSDQVENVFKLVVEDKSNEEMKGRWNDKPSDYGPAPILAIVLSNTRRIALKYIDENCPQSFFRPLFLPLEEQREYINNMKNNGSRLERELFKDL